MNSEKKKNLINILVICLYFIWPYFFNSITNLFNLSDISYLYLLFGFNFIFLFIVVYIYKDIFKKYFDILKKNLKKNIINSLKIFIIGVVLFAFLNYFLRDILKITEPNTINSMANMFKKIPVLFVLNTLFYYPVVEEIVFKMTLKNVLKNKWYFIVITGFLNAFFQIVFSMNNITDLFFITSYTVFISSFSYIYYKTNNIIYPIIFRVCYNLIPCIIFIIDLLH